MIKIRIFYNDEEERSTVDRITAAIESILEGKQKQLGIKIRPQPSVHPSKSVAIDLEIEK